VVISVVIDPRPGAPPVMRSAAHCADFQMEGGKKIFAVIVVLVAETNSEKLLSALLTMKVFPSKVMRASETRTAP
jgi:hypothetical protein